VVATEYATGAPPLPTALPPGPVQLPGRSVWALRVLRAPAHPAADATEEDRPAAPAAGPGRVGWPGDLIPDSTTEFAD
jgi:hypothetical protein